MKNVMNALLTFVITMATTLSSAIVNAETITYYHLDALGSPVAASDASGAILWREEYAPYGDRIRIEDPSNTHGFTGKFHEEDIGLTYFGARWYDPVAGRFMGIDPVDYREGDSHSFNRYAYANNNPYKFVDPDGRAAQALTYGAARVTIVPALNAITMWGFRTTLGVLVYDVLHNESSSSNELSTDKTTPAAPSLPDTIVGDQSDDRAGSNKSGKRHTSGKLLPKHGGSGDFEQDLKKLGGNVRPWQPGDSAPPGSLIGENGVFDRPKNSSGGASIDIPSKGDKPHETLHY